MFITKAKHDLMIAERETQIAYLKNQIHSMAHSIADRQGALEYVQHQLNDALATIEALRPRRDARGRFIG